MFRRSRRPATETLEEPYAVEQTVSRMDDRPGHDYDDQPLPDEAAADPPPAPAVTGFVEPLAELAPARHEFEASTVIGPATVVEGAVRTPDDLKVEGSVGGVVEVGGALTIERGGSVDAQVEAQKVLVRGRLNGEVHGRRRLEVARGGHIEGSFRTEALIIEEGAIVHGRFSMGRDAVEAPARAEAEEAI